MNYWELLLFISSALTLGAIVRSFAINQKTLMSEGMNEVSGKQIILLALVVPLTLQVIYYFLLILPGSEFSRDIELRAAIIRPSIFANNIILCIYFLNGRLVLMARRGVQSWRRYFPMR